MDLEKPLEEDLKYFKTNINRELLFKNLLVFTAEKKSIIAVCIPVCLKDFIMLTLTPDCSRYTYFLHV